MEWILDSRNYYFIALVIIVFSIAMFMTMFEKKKPKTGEIVMVSVMISLAVISRIVFFMTPQFKPMAAIIIITGIAFGGKIGFLCGAIATFITNMFYGQGPWTPWQMFAFGMVGLIMGAFFHRTSTRKEISRKYIIFICVTGALVVQLVYGLIVDTSNVLLYTDAISLEALFASYMTGFVYNFIHAVSTAIFLGVMVRPVLKTINRIKMKYGIFRDSNT